MKSIPTPVRLALAVAAALAAGAACASLPQNEQEVAQASSAQLRQAYLECDRLAADSRLDEGTMSLCAAVGHTLLERDFAGDLDKQLQWWHKARQAYAREVPTHARE